MIKKIIIFLFAVLAAHLLLVISGYDYLYTVLRMTVFKGKLGPAVDEYKKLPNDTVRANPDHVFVWPQGSDYNKRPLPDSVNRIHEELGTIAYLVIKDDSVRHEQYRDGFDEDSPSNSFSMAKSIVGILTGIAVDEGLIKSVKQPVCDFLPEYCNGLNAELTIEHLLTMSAGMNFKESYLNPFVYPAKANYGQDLKELHKNYRAVQSPGTEFYYKSGVTQVLTFVLEEAVGMSVSEYAQQKLWQPLRARNDAYWTKDLDDKNLKAFCCFNSNARDFALFGALYMNHGYFNGRRIVDSAYVAKSVTPADTLIDRYGNRNVWYGYKWWIELNHKNEFDFYYMRGLKGQYVIVIPERDMIIVRLGKKRRERGPHLLPIDVEYWIDGAFAAAGIED